MTGPSNCDQKSQTAACCSTPVEAVGESRAPIQADTAKLPWIVGSVDTAAGKIPLVETKLQTADILGSWKARWGIRRMGYRIEPRLYAVGNPTEASPVFVTANYKMSFDCLRSHLSGMDGWILVLDTKGINVWCAAGKGTFGTVELVHRIEAVGLNKIVSHRRLVVPQLGATGVSAHQVREQSGFLVTYGPVRAKDIPAFMKARMTATPEMRKITFPFADRIVLVPVEIVSHLKYAIFAAACFLLLAGLGAGVYSLDRVARYSVINALFPLTAVLCGATLPAVLLPWLPGRAFSVKGAVTGILPMLGVIFLLRQQPQVFRHWLTAAGWLLLFPATTSFMGMNFTGSSTYTSLSGVKKEMHIALPIQIAGAVCGLGLWVAGLFV